MVRGLGQVLCVAAAALTASAVAAWGDSEAYMMGIVPRYWGELDEKPREPNAPVPPVVVPQWSSSISYDGNFMNIQVTDGSGIFRYDSSNRRYRMTYEAKVSYFHPNEKMSRDELSRATAQGSEENTTLSSSGDEGACLPFPSSRKYQDIFGWLQVASFKGKKVQRGVPCDVWTFSSKPLHFQVEACIDADNLPREFKRVLGAGGGKWHFVEHLLFTDFILKAPGDTAFEPTRACAVDFPQKPCPSSTVEAMSTYRIWNVPEPLDLGNRNTGDVLGDLSFVCTQGSGPMYRSKLITHWSVEVMTDFGQYALCNYNGTDNVCSGPPEQLRRVGRRSGQFGGSWPLLGQCSSNDDVGSQYSFPREAKCPPGISPGPSTGCSWGNAKPLRTVEAKCVMEDRGLLEACSHDIGHAPFRDAEAIWHAAFASSDPARGGCPDAPVAVPVFV